MGQNPCIDLYLSIRINLIGVIPDLHSLGIQQRPFLLEIILRIRTVHLYVKRKFILQNRILIGTEHQCNGSSHQRQGEQGGQCSQGKLHGAHLGGKLPQKEQILPCVDPPALSTHIADDPGGQSNVKEINGDHQANQE